MKKILMIGLLILAMTGTAWAFNSTDHTSEAKSMVGDVLIYPVYLADGTGWEAKITVINTSNDLSTVAKVVIHGGKNSQELLDFFIYLSPDDMWTAKIYNDGGVVKIFSDDDSVRSGMTTWGDQVPLDQALVNNACDEEAYGYVTIFDDWTMTRAALGTAVNENFTTGPIPKSYVLQAYQDANAFHSADILTGSYEIMLPALGLSAMENAVVLQNYDINAELLLGRFTYFGQDCRNSIAEVEAEISKEAVFMPYYHDGDNITAHIFTFPTKQTTVNTTCAKTGVNSLYFTQHSVRPDYCVEYGIKPFDLEENTPGSTSPIFSPVPAADKRQFCEEVNIAVVGLDSSITWYDEGWALYTFQLAPNQRTSGPTDQFSNNETINFTGTPVIPLSANLGADGLSLKYGAYDPAVISYTYGSVE